MNSLLHCISNFYSQILHLYPRSFRDEFAEEMKIVFGDSVHEAGKEGMAPLIMLFLRELSGLPVNILREFLHEFERKEKKMIASEDVNPGPEIGEKTNPWDAFIATLPFVLFGVVSMLAKFDLLFHGSHAYLNDVYLDLAFYVMMLIGLFWGLMKGIPHWTYSFLGWSLTFVWLSYWFLGAVTGFELVPFSWQTWLPLLATIAAALILRRSLNPLFQLFRGVWQDWTLLSIAMYTFVGFMMLEYDENHSPYLIAFMIASTLAISASVWGFMRSSNPLHRFLTLLSGFAVGVIIGRISESTWDVAAYYGLPAQPPMPWYDSILDVIVITGFWGVILLLPALVGFVRSVLKTSKVA